jgi:RNA polymerase sigma-32 factor
MNRAGNMHVKSENHFDLRRCVPMSREEEHRCALEYVRTKDPALAQRLVVANMRMVAALAHRYCRADRDFGDFIQEGNRGLLKAVDKYDPTRGIRFCTYAVWWIRAYMLSFTMTNWRLVKVGTTQAQRKLFFGLRKERDRLEQEGAEATPRELASRLQVTESEVVAMLERFAGSETSLDLPARSRETEGATVGELLSDTSAPGPDQRVEDAEFTQVLRSKLGAFGATLRGREAHLFRQRLLSDEPVTLVQLAAQFGVTRERTRQLEQRLKSRIRVYLQRELGDAFEVPVGATGRRRGLVTTEEMAEAGVFEETSYPMWVPEVALSQVSS